MKNTAFTYCIIILFTITILGGNTANAQSFAQDLEQTAIDHNLIGMSVVVTCGNELVDIYHYGIADIGNDISVNDDTHYRFASVAKAVTATALMKLYEEAYFNLDDDISTYLGYTCINPDFPTTPITFRMLLSHTSSLQDGDGYNSFLSATYSNTSIPNISELLLPDGNYYTPNMWRTESPGTHFQYSNINYGLIGTLIEKISGQRFDIYVKEQILEPLGITGSFNVNDLPNINQVAILYRNAIPQADQYNGTYPIPIDSASYTIGSNGVLFGPQGSLRISALDLSKFMRMHYNYGTYNGVSILDSTTVALMHSPQWTFDGSNGNNYFNLFNQWGLGIQSTTNTPGGDIVINEKIMYGHAGEAYGLISDLYFDKISGIGLIFVTNGYYGSSGYAWGINSAFYQPEEEVFSTIANYYNTTCETIVQVHELSSLANEKPTITYQNSGVINIPQIYLGKQLLIYNMHGQLIESRTVSANRITTDFLAKGVYVIGIDKHNIFIPITVY